MNFEEKGWEEALIVSLFLGHQFGSENSQNFFFDEYQRHNNFYRYLDWEGNEHATDFASAVIMSFFILSRLTCPIDEKKMTFSEKSYFLHGKFNPFLQRKQDDSLPPSLDCLFNSICNTFDNSKQIVKEGAWCLNYHHVKSIISHFSPSYCVIFDYPGARLITAGDDGIVRIWCVKTGFLIGSLRGHTSCICDLSLESTNKYLATCSLDQTIRIWDFSALQTKILIRVESPILTVEFDPGFDNEDKLLLMCTCSDGYLRLWSVDIKKGTFNDPPLKYFCKTLSRDTIRLASFSPSGKRIITGATDGIIRLLATPSKKDVERGTGFPTLQPYICYLEDHQGYVNCLHFSIKGTEFITGSWDGTVRLWSFSDKWTAKVYDTSSDRERDRQKGRKVTMVSFAGRDSLIVAAVKAPVSIWIFSRATGEVLHQLDYHSADVQILTCHPFNDNILLSAGYDGKAALWDLKRGKLIFSHRSSCKFLDGCFSPAGMHFSLTDDLGRVSIFATGVSEDSYSLSPDSQFLASDWHTPIFSDNGIIIDPLTQRPTHTQLPDQTFSLDGIPNPKILRKEFFDTFKKDIWNGSIEKSRLRKSFEEQYCYETKHFEHELLICPPGVSPKHSKSRKKRVVFGSDVEEHFQNELGENFNPQGNSNDARPFSDEEYINGTVDEGSNYEIESEEILSPRIRSRTNPLIFDEEDEVYEPSKDRAPRSRKRSKKRNMEKVVNTPQPSEWLSIEDRRYSPYLPQVYDIVRYFPEGHKLFLEHEIRDVFNTDLPWLKLRHLPNVVCAQIVEMTFFVLDGLSCCSLVLIQLNDDSIVEAKENLDPAKGERFVVRFYDMDCVPDFIILGCRYEWAINNAYKIGDIVQVIYGHEERYVGKIIGVPVRRKSPWQSYTVEWVNLDDPPEKCSPWELEPAENEDGNEYICGESLPENAMAILEEGLRKLMQSERAEFLLKPVDYAMFPDYLEAVAYPMYLEMIYSRLVNGFYRRFESFLWDGELIRSNTLIYNEETSEIVKDATFVGNMLQALVRKAQRPSRNSSHRADDVSTSSPEVRKSTKRRPILEHSEEDDIPTPSPLALRRSNRRS